MKAPAVVAKFVLNRPFVDLLGLLKFEWSPWNQIDGGLLKMLNRRAKTYIFHKVCIILIWNKSEFQGILTLTCTRKWLILQCFLPIIFIIDAFHSYEVPDQVLSVLCGAAWRRSWLFSLERTNFTFHTHNWDGGWPCFVEDLTRSLMLLQSLIIGGWWICCGEESSLRSALGSHTHGTLSFWKLHKCLFGIDKQIFISACRATSKKNTVREISYDLILLFIIKVHDFDLGRSSSALVVPASVAQSTSTVPSFQVSLLL